MRKILILLFILSFTTASCIEGIKPQTRFLVKGVIDGDTIELEDGRQVRYIGIDTPEIRKMIGGRWVYNPQPYALEAKEFNRNLVENKIVKLEFDVVRKDKYSRLLAYVYEGEKMINLELLKEGFAMLYTFPPNVRHVEKFILAQKEARTNKKGFWGDLEKDAISYKEAKDFIGRFKAVEGRVKSVYSSKKVLILKFGRNKDDFKVAIFKNSFPLFFKKGIIFPENYYKGQKIKVHGLIKEYKGSSEIVVYDPFQIEIIE